MYLIEVFNEVQEFIFSIIPDEEDVVYESNPQGGLDGVGVDMVVFEISHKKVCKCWCYPGAHGCSPYLYEMFPIEFKVVEFKDHLEKG